MKTILPILISICAAMNVPVGLGSEERILHTFRSDAPDQRFEDLLYLSAGVEFMRAGFSSTRREEGQDYVLSTEYGSVQDKIFLRFDLYRNADRENMIAGADTTIALDHDFSTRIADAVANLMKSAGLVPVFSTEAQIDGLLRERPGSTSKNEPPAEPAVITETAQETATVDIQEPFSERMPMVLAPPVPLSSASEPEPFSSASDEAERATAGEPAGLPETVGESAAGETASLDPDASGAPEIAVEASDTEPEKRSVRVIEPVRFVASISAAGLFLIGPITEFFHYGASGFFTAGFLLPGDGLGFTVGARVSFTRVFNDDGVSGGPLYLSTAGPDLQFVFGTNVRLSAGTSGGAAILTVAGPDRVLSKTVPYVDLGILASVRIFGSRFSLGGEVRFMMVFDNDIMIMGTSPTLSLKME